MKDRLGNNRRKFVQEFITIDHETHDHRVAILEVVDEKIIATYYVRVPQPYLRCQYGFPLNPN